jgi:hypothetical protein
MRARGGQPANLLLGLNLQEPFNPNTDRSINGIMRAYLNTGDLRPYIPPPWSPSGGHVRLMDPTLHFHAPWSKEAAEAVRQFHVRVRSSDLMYTGSDENHEPWRAFPGSVQRWMNVNPHGTNRQSIEDV